MAIHRERGPTDDLVTFSRRDDLDPITKAAVLHAQFETIHPFADGNGRCGRALLQKSLRRDGVLMNTALPISAGLLHDVTGYMRSLDAYHRGDPLAPVSTLLDSLDVALSLGSDMASKVDEVLDSWRLSITARKGSAIWSLPGLLVEHPVVTSALVAKRLGITERAARDLLERATEYDIVTPRGNARRGRFYQADDVIEILDEASRGDAIRREFPS